MKITVEVNQSYEIELGHEIVGKRLETLCADKDYIVCIDEVVLSCHEKLLHRVLDNAQAVIEIKSLESLKTQDTVDSIHQTLFRYSASRSTILLAIGGGIVGDIAGYAAATYMRGIPFVQVPTTLLSQVDSSIGGKVAVNQFGIKNLIGTFYSPRQVIIDTIFLGSLSERLFKSGLVELLKHGFIADASIITMCDSIASITDLRRDIPLLLLLIEKSLLVKKSLVEADFYDNEVRHALNYGHTFAHALELSQGAHLYHGECVAIGMLVMAKIADEQVYKIMSNVLEKFRCIKPLKAVDLSKTMYDKKREGSSIQEVLVERVGSFSLVTYNTHTLIELFETAYADLAKDKLKTTESLYTFQGGALKGTVQIPPSKSLTHRYLIAASLSDRPTMLHCVHEISDDIQVTIDVLEQLGAKILWNQKTGKLHINPMNIGGTANERLLCEMGESGTSLRLLLPLLIILTHEVKITGKNKLPFRPLHPYIEMFDMVAFKQDTEHQFLPLSCAGRILPGKYTLPGHISSQFLSGLLFSLPLLTGDSTITLTTPLESAPYVAMTLSVLSQFSIQITHDATYTNFFIKGNQKYCSMGVYEIEQDFSARCFWEVAQALNGSEIDIVPESRETLQGDKELLRILLSNEPVDLKHMPDVAPIAAVYMCQFGGKFLHTERLQYKESDRLVAICKMLDVMGITYHADDRLHTLCIEAGTASGGLFDTFNDHRIAMSLIIASTITTSAVCLREVKSIEKSYVGFIETFKKLGGIVDEQ